MPNFLTPPEAAVALGISKNTIYDLIRKGDLPSYRVGKKIRIDPKDITEYINHQRRGAKAPELNLKAVVPQETNTRIISGQDLSLDVLARMLEQREGISVLRSQQASSNGLQALYSGQVHLASCHLWDAHTDTYNIPYARYLLPGMNFRLYRILSRQAGFYILKDNPKKLTGWDDFLRHDLTFINREKGSGARVLVDETLRTLKIRSETIPGYDKEAGNHLEVASAVSQGAADFGVGIESVASLVPLVNFIPLKKEHYDLVVPNQFLEDPSVQKLIGILQSSDFRAALDSFGFYDTSETGTLIYEQ